MKFWKHIAGLIRLNRAMVFVDYEYWFYSYRNLYGMKPDLAAWIEELRKEYCIVDVRVFADFSLAGLYDEKKKILAVTDSVQDTTEESVYRKKDMTDFVMLDSLYQSVNEARNIGTYILFTGDGHFSSVVKYITKKKRRKVVIYGVQESISRRLQDCATKCVALPFATERFSAYRRMIIENLAYVMDKSDIIPTFMGTVSAVVRKYDVNAGEVHTVLSDMIARGLVVRKDYNVEFKRTIRIIAANWDKLIEEGYWDPAEQCVLERK